MCVQLLLCAAPTTSGASAFGGLAEVEHAAPTSPAAAAPPSAAAAAAWPPAGEEDVHSLRELFERRPPAPEAKAAPSVDVKKGGANLPAGTSSAVLLAAAYENGHLYVIETGLERVPPAPCMEGAGADETDDAEAAYLRRMGAAAGRPTAIAGKPELAAAGKPAASHSGAACRGSRFRLHQRASAPGAAPPLPNDGMVHNAGNTSHALLALQLAMQPILALAISSDCSAGVAGSAEAAVVLFSLDIPKVRCSAAAGAKVAPSPHSDLSSNNCHFRRVDLSSKTCPTSCVCRVQVKSHAVCRCPSQGRPPRAFSAGGATLHCCHLCLSRTTPHPSCRTPLSLPRSTPLQAAGMQRCASRRCPHRRLFRIAKPAHPVNHRRLPLRCAVATAAPCMQ